ncbi:hypothetical protein ASPWEDRAFT_595071 [Aspergillus wentii DTO 134E9]|uniref:Uncharacterized protein n=1 Tax=Aspergillus wentii DTO 134E9 TaxID=1073089 RepID=A0A1L9RD49_ASPWE|nr:uncharacterized protein ASPWEDRAFT_595071 [Aspergillus wentii DTO 134E9]OJJ32841.1 hypothetical protein ASPWEDRAFT_595071 [Aspergillus wentii DTO 134E9]
MLRKEFRIRFEKPQRPSLPTAKLRNQISALIQGPFERNWKYLERCKDLWIQVPAHSSDYSRFGLMVAQGLRDEQPKQSVLLEMNRRHSYTLTHIIIAIWRYHDIHVPTTVAGPRMFESQMLEPFFGQVIPGPPDMTDGSVKSIHDTMLQFIRATSQPNLLPDTGQD